MNVARYRCVLFAVLFFGAFVFAADKPNVIVIITDDQGWADIGYNNDKVYTPHMDKLASTGVTFVNHYVMPQCTPTRVAAMTGRYPGRFGGNALQASNAPAFPLGTPTMANMFKASGYVTHQLGKWHLGSKPSHGPNHFGFDHSYGSLAGAVGNYNHQYRKGEFGVTWHRDHKIIEGYENGTHTTDLTATEAVRIIEKKRDKPLFMYVAFHAVHTPLDERGKFTDRPTQLDPKDKKRWLNEDEIEWFNDPAGKIQAEPDPEKRLLLAAAYHLDHAIGQIVDALDRTDQRDNTLILFSSDNGPQGSWGGNAYPDDLKLTDFNQPLPFRGKKVDVWEGGIHVPGFANWPGKLKPREMTQTVHIVDWFPTLAKLIGYAPEDWLVTDGIDIAPALFDGKKLPDRDLYWTWRSPVNRWALRHGDWKIVKYGTGAPKAANEWKLYNLADDPKESNDLAKAKPDKLAAMHERFLAHRAKDAK